MSLQVVEYTGSIEALRPLAVAWRQEADAETFGLSLDVNVFLADLQGLQTDAGSALLVLTEHNVPRGFMGLIHFDSTFGPDTLVQEHYWYVDPDHRTMGSFRLITEARRWAASRGAKGILFTASLLSSDKHDKLVRFYERLGMSRIETTYLERL